ncbi:MULTISPECIES: hypothetical protein [Arthrobacter]|uniref:DUF308 domain-containing protein n=2 Tax=Arthrobacter TaxID=1663 RepID=A0ABU9KJX1_9MICC|nr:hypothetical protein [Arthrobacter sp. YJM1]MDP5227133.1 hypothetical protein [Arthrobacter sp. YJM1]
MESDYSAADALTDVDSARSSVASRVRAPGWYYGILACWMVLSVVSTAWFPPALAALSGGLIAASSAFVASDRRKRFRERFRPSDLWPLAGLVPLLLLGYLGGLLVRFGQLPEWSGWVLAALLAVLGVLVMRLYERSRAALLRAGR